MLPEPQRHVAAERSAHTVPFRKVWPFFTITALAMTANTIVQPVIGLRLMDQFGLPAAAAIGFAGATVTCTALAMMFAIMTSYTRARAESLIEKCKVGFMERPERIVLFMIGAFTNRMAAVMWVIGVLSVFTVADRIIYTYRELRDARPEPAA